METFYPHFLLKIGTSYNINICLIPTLNYILSQMLQTYDFPYAHKFCNNSIIYSYANAPIKNDLHLKITNLFHHEFVGF